MNCDDLYKKVISGDCDNHYVLFDLSQCFIDGYDKEKLRLMLRSADMGIVVDGLFIASEIGSLVAEYIEDLEALESSDDSEVKRRAKELLNTYAPDRPNQKD